LNEISTVKLTIILV